MLPDTMRTREPSSDALQHAAQPTQEFIDLSGTVVIVKHSLEKDR